MNENRTNLPLPKVELIWEVPVEEGPIVSMVVHRGKIYTACARRVFQIDVPVPTFFPWTDPTVGDNDASNNSS